MQENNKPVVEVLSISDDLEIKSIFRHRTWRVKEGIDCLVGIFQENKLPDGTFELITLDGRRYSSAQHKSEIDDLNKRSKILEEIWDSTGRKRERYRPKIFLEWGMEYRDIAIISWYEDAFAKGLLDSTLSTQSRPVATEDQKPLNPKSKTTLLKIIAGLTVLSHEKLGRGLKGRIQIEFMNLAEKYPEIYLDKEVLRKNLDEAWKTYLPKGFGEN